MPTDEPDVQQQNSFLDVRREHLDGYCYESGNGQLVIDLHQDDEEHLTSPATRDTQPLYDCRRYVKELVPKEWLGRKGRFYVDRSVVPATGDVVSVTISFVPSRD